MYAQQEIAEIINKSNDTRKSFATKLASESPEMNLVGVPRIASFEERNKQLKARYLDRQNSPSASEGLPINSFK